MYTKCINGFHCVTMALQANSSLFIHIKQFFDHLLKLLCIKFQYVYLEHTSNYYSTDSVRLKSTKFLKLQLQFGSVISQNHHDSWTAAAIAATAHHSKHSIFGGEKMLLSATKWNFITDFLSELTKFAQYPE